MAKAERQIGIAGPITYPWGPKRPRYPYRAHEMNSAAKLLARGCEAIGIDWTETPLATMSAPHRAPQGKSSPCVYRGFCRFGCSTNAKRSALTVWIPRALTAGAEIRDLAMVGRIETGPDGRATGVHYHREGEWRFQRARNVVVAGYAVETPRLLLNSANERYPDGLANSSGLVGKNLMTQSNQAVWGRMEQEVRWNKGPPSLAITEHWNYDDKKDFFGGYCWMGQGPLPIEWAAVQTGSRGLWGEALRDAMLHYNHMIGVKMVGEMLPDEANRVTLADDLDQYGLRVARITYKWGDNDKALIQHALEQMGRSIEAIGATDMFRQEDDTNHLGGTARMGDDPARSVVERRLPQLGHPEPVGLRRIGVPHRGRREPGADHPDDRHADGIPDRHPRQAGRAVSRRRCGGAGAHDHRPDRDPARALRAGGAVLPGQRARQDPQLQGRGEAGEAGLQLGRRRGRR